MKGFPRAGMAALLSLFLMPGASLSAPPDVMMGSEPSSGPSIVVMEEGPSGSVGFVTRGGPPMFLFEVFPPKFVMENQQAIGLRPAQVEAIKKAMAEAQQELLDLQWKLEADSQVLAKLLNDDRVDEQGAMKKLGEVTTTEQQVKRVNFRLLVRIKNELDPAQQQKLRALRPKFPGLPPPPM
jgi:hypothetical protein